MIFRMETQINITGTEIAYLYICRRKLWLFHHGVRLENEHANVQIGRFIQQSTFTRYENRKEIVLGNIGVVDRAELKKGIIHETKKGKAPAKADEAQVCYYMWWMRNHGIKIHTCIIHYPKQKRTRELAWTPDMEQAVKDNLAEARKIVNGSVPPVFTAKNICKRCAYQEFCFV